MSAEIGHNGGPTFDDIVRDNLDRGLLLTMKETILSAVRDPRLDRRHLRVLAEVIACINSVSGQAYPSRKSIAEATRRYEVAGVRETSGYSEAGISKTLSELVGYGYLVSAKRAVEQGGRALSIYTIRRPSMEELQEQITEWVESVRQAPKRADFTHVGKVRGKVSVESPDCTPVGNVKGPVPTPVGNDRGADSTSVGNVTPVGKDRADFTSDFTYVVPTVTKTPELEERTESSAGERDGSAMTEAPSKYPPPLPGEEHIGHGVYANGETIRHAAFAISIAGIRMQTINAGLPLNEIRDLCAGHALQWGLEIENGARPDKVLPTKIANFLARSIMGDVNQRKIQTVREEKQRQPYDARGRPSPSAAAGVEKIETEQERIKRFLIEGLK